VVSSEINNGIFVGAIDSREARSGFSLMDSLFGGGVDRLQAEREQEVSQLLTVISRRIQVAKLSQNEKVGKDGHMCSPAASMDRLITLMDVYKKTR